MSKLKDKLKTSPSWVARELLPLVQDVSDRLAKNREIPLDLQAVIDKVHDRLPLLGPDPSIPSVDPYLAGALAAGLARCYRVFAENGPHGRKEIRLGLEHVRQALAYIVEEAPTAEDRSPREITSWLIETAESSDSTIAAILDVNPKTIRRWSTGVSKPSGDEAAKLRVLARVIENLRFSLTTPGVLLWMTQPHIDLGDRTPKDLLNEPQAYGQLVTLAARTRSHGAA